MTINIGALTCGGYRTRTGHLKIANLTLYQMS